MVHPHIKISVIIVNYNVEHFLEQCLHSVKKALKNIAGEIFVVDNNSVDGSVGMVKEKFSEVHLIANKNNHGFSYANNQAIKQSKGEYVLLLNPDTVVEEDTFEKIVHFMDTHPDAGGLGVKMLDGKGNFLPESKRGLPTPSVAFYKIFGLSKLFPKSKTFGKYHLGFLDNDKINEVDVLAGAFMLLRKTTLDKIGLLDESFFMYGEDIDLSYRITLGGYKNYYFPETRIIHYKGESTKKSSVNYVFVFYNAMIIFAKKHFSQNNAQLFSFLINIAIYFRAGISLISRLIKQLALPAFDAALIFTGIFFIKNYYEQNIKFTEGGTYPIEFIRYVVPSYIFIWLITIFFSGGYDKPVKLTRIIRGTVIGTGIILIIYALLPENFRFSRALILLGATWVLTSILFTRMLLHLLKIKSFALDGGMNKRLAVVGNEEECKRVHNLLNQTSLQSAFVGYVSTDDNPDKKKFIGNIDQLKEVIGIYNIDEVIFCAKDLTAQKIIHQMAELGSAAIEFKIAPPESLSVIGSNSINTSGDLYTIDINSIAKPSNKRNKRLLDMITSVLLLIFFPILIFAIKKPIGLLKNIFNVLFGKNSWVGYTKTSNTEDKLVRIKPGIITPTDKLKEQDQETIERLNFLYAKDYNTISDIKLITNNFRELGR